MKKILLGLLLLSGLCSFAKDKKDKPEPAFKKGDITAIVAYGAPNFWQKPSIGWPVLRGSGIVAAEYQLSRAFNAGLQYSYFSLGTGMQSTTNRFTHTAYQQEKWKKGSNVMVTGDYCYLNRGRISLSAGLGIFFCTLNSTYHTIDSVGISTHGAYSPDAYLGLDVRLTTAKVKITKNLGVCGGLKMTRYAFLALGACYTFTGQRK